MFFAAIWHSSEGFSRRKHPMDFPIHGMERPFHPVCFVKTSLLLLKKGPRRGLGFAERRTETAVRFNALTYGAQGVVRVAAPLACFAAVIQKSRLALWRGAAW